MGGVVLWTLEKGAMADERARYSRAFRTARANMTADAFAELQLFLPGDPATFGSEWDHFENAVFFASTIMTTVGYGNFAPTTPSGRLFTALFGIFSIAVMGFWMKEITMLFERVVSRSLTHVIADAHLVTFNKFDHDNSGMLDRAEVRALVADLRRVNDLPDLTPDQFALFWDAADNDASGYIEVFEFKRACLLLNVDVREILIEQWKFSFAAATFAACLVGSMLIFAYVYDCEHWSLADSFYFSVVTLMTIGLGDFTPMGAESGCRGWRTLMVVIAIPLLGSAAVFVSSTAEWLEVSQASKKREKKRRRDSASGTGASAGDDAARVTRKATSVLPQPDKGGGTMASD